MNFTIHRVIYGLIYFLDLPIAKIENCTIACTDAAMQISSSFCAEKAVSRNASRCTLQIHEAGSFGNGLAYWAGNGRKSCEIVVRPGRYYSPAGRSYNAPISRAIDRSAVFSPNLAASCRKSGPGDPRTAGPLLGPLTARFTVLKPSKRRKPVRSF